MPLLIVCLALLRFGLGLLPGYPADMDLYKRWALVAGVRGIRTVYDEPAPAGAAKTTIENLDARYDYPPLYAYLLAPAGRIYSWIEPEPVLRFESSRLFTLLVKIPPLLFDLLTALLLAWIVTRKRLWGEHPTWMGWLPALLYLFHPAVLFDSGYWGQPDAVHVFFVLLSLTLILERRPNAGWISATLACSMKPLAAPFLPLLALATLLRCGFRGLLSGGAAALATALVVFAPFLLSGRGPLVFQRLVSDVNAMPFTSANAHNLWWLSGPWKDAQRPLLGPITATLMGQLIFGASYLWLALRLHKIERVRPERAEDAWFLAAAAVAFSFFFFATHMHENHLFALIPLTIVLAGGGRPWIWFAAGVGWAILLNLAAHDWAIGEALIGKLASPSHVIRPDTGDAIPFAAYAIGIVNAGCVVVLYAMFVAIGTSRASLAPSMESERSA